MNNFRKQIFRTLLPLMTFPMPFLLQSAVPEEMKIDLKTGMWCYLAGRQEKPVSHIYSETEKSISFRFQSDGVKWADVWLKKISPSLPVREKYLIRASFRVPAGSPVNRISLRMRDAEREIFQYPKTVDFSKGGTFTENWTVTDREWKNSWGGNKNHIPDMPIHFLGFSFSWNKIPDEEIQVELLAVSILPDSQTQVYSRRTVYPFDEAIYKKSGSGTLTPTSRALLVSRINGTTILGRRNIPEKKQEKRPEYFLLTAEPVSGETNIALNLKDSRNKIFTTRATALPFPGGRYKLLLPDHAKELVPPFSVDSIRLTSQNGAVLLKELAIVCRESPADAVDFDVQTGTPFHLLKKGQEEALKYSFSNRADCGGKFTLKLRWRHYSGREFTEQRDITLRAGETAEIRPGILPKQYGHYEVEAEIQAGGGNEAPAYRKNTFAYFQPAGPTPGRPEGFLFGMNTKASLRMERTIELEAMAACGVKIIRQGFFLTSIQPQRGVWNFNGTDRLVADAGKFNMEVQVLPVYLPQWLQPHPGRMYSFTYPNDLNEWMNFYRKFAERYRGRIRFYETCNEPDLVKEERLPLDRYIEMQNAAYKALTETDPQARLLAGGFAGVGLPWGRKNFHETVLGRTKGKFHIHATHEHGSFQKYAHAADLLAEYRKKNGVENVPWYPNETGAVSMYGGERFQAECVFKKILFSFARGAIAYNWYSSRDDGCDPFNSEHHYGLMTWDYHPKPSYSVYNMLAGSYRNVKFERQLNLEPGAWGFIFRRERELLLPLWNELTQPKIQIFRTDAARATLRDIMGNDTPLSLRDGVVFVNISSEPVTLLLHGADNVKEDGALIRLANLPVMIPGRPQELEFTVRNPFQSPEQVYIAAENLPEGFHLEQQEISCEIEAGSSRKIRLRVHTPSGKLFPSNTVFLNLTCRLGEIPTELQIPLNPAKLIPTVKKQADFLLNSSTQLIALTHGDPRQAHRIWQGPQDCSAEIRLYETDHKLTIEAEVTDDIHFQDGRGGLWNGDSVQCCFQLPGQSGFWEINAGLLNDGTVRTGISNTPLGFNSERAAEQIRARISRNGTKTIYHIEIPFHLFGTEHSLKAGFQFNLLINDNDGEGRDGWLHIAPGIGENKNPEKYPFIIFEQ